jgi:hypothetical protein
MAASGLLAFVFWRDTVEWSMRAWWPKGPMN